MNRRACLIVPLLALAVLAGCGRRLSPTEARDLLRRVHQARETACVRGELTTTVQVGDQALSAEARLVAGPDHSELAFLTGKYAGWRVVQQDGLVWRVDPQGKPHPGQGGLGGLGFGGHDPLLVVTRGLPGRLAGRRVEHYRLRPRGSHRARLELAVDAATGYPLRAVRYGVQGQILSSTVFRRVEFGGKPPPRTAVPAVAQSAGPAGKHLRTRPATSAQLATALKGPLLLPRRLPEGFAPVGYYLSETRRGPLAEIRYSDGLRVLVLLQMEFRRPEATRMPGRPWELTGRRPGLAPRFPLRDRPGGWFGWRPLGPRGETGEAMRQALRSRLRGHVLRERKGSRLIVLAGDLTTDQLQAVMDSIPSPPAPTTRF